VMIVVDGSTYSKSPRNALNVGFEMKALTAKSPPISSKQTAIRLIGHFMALLRPHTTSHTGSDVPVDQWTGTLPQYHQTVNNL